VNRIGTTPRPDWQRTVRAQGLTFAEADRANTGSLLAHWDETACYTLELAEVLRLEAVTQELHEMCLAAARHVVRTDRYADFGIPTWAAIAVQRSLEGGPPSLCGRLDLWYDGSAPAKLLDYSADTPTTLVETAILQWYWLEETRPNQDQWNSLHDRLVAGWRTLAPRLAGPTVHFAWSDLASTDEDLMNAGYLAETARQAGLATRLLPMRMIGWDGSRFTDDLNTSIDTCFKLYPWEWMLREPYGRLALTDGVPTTWIEPAWKLLLANKALLAILWELYPDHPNLLPAYLHGPQGMREYVAKPLHARDGAAIKVVTPSGERVGPGRHTDQLYCYQRFLPLPSFDGNRVVLGSWVVADGQGKGRPAGVGFRESPNLILDGYARFIPHFVPR
jgi:glutathionylspermidine synthase